MDRYDYITDANLDLFKRVAKNKQHLRGESGYL
jgi:hypothetical protein